MKLFVKVDFWVQVILYTYLLLGWLVYGFPPIWFFLLFIGGWQLISGIVLAMIFGDRQRVQYLKYAMLYLFISSFLFFLPEALFWVYLIGAFGIAIWYSKITYIHHRRLQTTFRSFWDLEI